MRPLRLLLAALASAALLPAGPLVAESADLWGSASEPAHATRHQRLRAVADADARDGTLLVETSPRHRGSFVIVDGPRTVSSFGHSARGGLHERVRGNALEPGSFGRSSSTVRGDVTLRLHGDQDGFRSGRWDRHRGFRDDGLVVRGNTRGVVILSTPTDHRDRFDVRTRGPARAVCPTTRSSFDRGFHRSSSFDRGFRSGFREGFETGRHTRHRGFRDAGTSVEFRFGHDR